MSRGMAAATGPIACFPGWGERAKRAGPEMPEGRQQRPQLAVEPGRDVGVRPNPAEGPARDQMPGKHPRRRPLSYAQGHDAQAEPAVGQKKPRSRGCQPNERARREVWIDAGRDRSAKSSRTRYRGSAAARPKSTPFRSRNIGTPPGVGREGKAGRPTTATVPLRPGPADCPPTASSPIRPRRLTSGNKMDMEERRLRDRPPPRG